MPCEPGTGLIVSRALCMVIFDAREKGVVTLEIEQAAEQGSTA